MGNLDFDSTLGANVGPGWEPIVNELYMELKGLDPDLVVDQVKEKFGSLRFYFQPSDTDRYDELNVFVYAAEAKCAQTCEACGSTDNVECSGGDFGWLKTLCGVCRTKWDKGMGFSAISNTL
jgi:hypothetical protein